MPPKLARVIAFTREQVEEAEVQQKLLSILKSKKLDAGSRAALYEDMVIRAKNMRERPSNQPTQISPPQIIMKMPARIKRAKARPARVVSTPINTVTPQRMEGPSDSPNFGNPRRGGRVKKAPQRLGYGKKKRVL